LKTDTPVKTETLYSIRHFITTNLLDIAGGLAPNEAMAVALSIYPSLMQLLFMSSRCWRHRGKWAARRGDALVEELSTRMQQAYAMAAAGQVDGFLHIAVDILDRVGGPLWNHHAEELVFR
jgi:hypothetical protein